jgi:hypothetical protein
MDVVNPVLDEHDFATVSSEDSLDGGWTGVSSSDDHAAGAKRRAHASHLIRYDSQVRKNTGGVLKRPKRHAWKACIGQPIESSNLSATANTPDRRPAFDQGFVRSTR